MAYSHEVRKASAAGELSASRPPVLFEQGKLSGSQGAPIPATVVEAYSEFLPLERRHLLLPPDERQEYDRAAYRASSRSEAERVLIATTAMERALDAGGFIAGYVPGILDFLDRGNQDGPWMSYEESRISFSPAIIAASIEGMRAYMAGHGFQEPPAYLDSANKVDGAGFSLAHDYALGFIVGAAALGERVSSSEVPATENESRAFQWAMATEEDHSQDFHELLTRVEDSDPAAGERLIRMNVLGREIKAAMQRTASGTDTA
jgi:hypothetical protein